MTVCVYILSDLDDKARWLGDRKWQRLHNGSFPVSADLWSSGSDSSQFALHGWLIYSHTLNTLTLHFWYTESVNDDQLQETQRIVFSM